MTILSDTVTAPAFLASAFVNGDWSSCNDADRACGQAILDKLASDGWHVVDVARDGSGEAYEPRFTWHFALYGGNASGGDVLDYVIHKVTV